MGDGPVYVGAKEVCQRWGISRSKLYSMMEAGEIPFVLIGQSKKIRIADVMAYESRISATAD